MKALLHDVPVPIVGRERHFEKGTRIARELLPKLIYC